jgi:GTP cyclohydrolase II
MTGDVFDSLRSACGRQFELAMKAVRTHGSGIILYLRQEERGIGLEIVERLPLNWNSRHPK